jgi:hypothetical protein
MICTRSQWMSIGNSPVFRQANHGTRYDVNNSITLHNTSSSQCGEGGTKIRDSVFLDERWATKPVHEELLSPLDADA